MSKKVTQITTKLSKSIINLDGHLSPVKIREYLQYEFGQEDNDFDYSHFDISKDEVVENKFFEDGKLAHTSALKIEDLKLSIGHESAYVFSKTL